MIIKMVKLKFFILISIIGIIKLYAQNYKIKNGIFLKFEDFKNNAPIPVEKIFFEKKSGIFLIDNVLENEKFKYKNDSDQFIEFYTGNIWGLYENGNIYVRRNKSFYKITYPGRISFFIGRVQTMISDYYNAYPSNQRTLVNNEYRQFLLDFETGEFLEFNEKNVEKLLSRDSLLYNEFKSLSKKQKKQLKFYYIRRYNEKYPLPFELE